MPVTLFNGAVVIPHPPDWRQPVEWSRGWDTRIESAVTGSEARVGLRLKPREKIRFRVVPYDLAERLALVARLRVAAKTGLALVPHWGRGAALTQPGSGASLTVEPDTLSVRKGDVVLVHGGDIEGFDDFDDFDVATVASFRNRTLTLTSPLSRSYPAGARVYPTLLGKVTISELEALDDWRQAVSIEVQQLRTVPDEAAGIVIGFDYWLAGTVLPRSYRGEEFGHWLAGAPLVSP